MDGNGGAPTNVWCKKCCVDPIPCPSLSPSPPLSPLHPLPLSLSLSLSLSHHLEYSVLEQSAVSKGLTMNFFIISPIQKILLSPIYGKFKLYEIGLFSFSNDIKIHLASAKEK